jgi:hypothetical protein
MRVARRAGTRWRRGLKILALGFNFSLRYHLLQDFAQPEAFRKLGGEGFSL